MANITKDSYIDSILCLLKKNGVDVSTLIRKVIVEDDSELGFHCTNKYEVVCWEVEERPIYKVGKNKNKYNTGKKELVNIPKDKVFFYSKLKYSLYLIELLKESQAKRK